MKTLVEIFDIWPSVADLGRDLGLPYPTVVAWKQRGSIPVAYWRPVISAARQRGYHNVDGDLLVSIHDRSLSQHDGLHEDGANGLQNPSTTVADQEDGQFSRWKHVRRQHFATMEEIVDHVRALRSEWDRR